MQTEIRKAHADGTFSAADLTEAVAVLQKGGVVGVPTDTVYGIAVLPDVTDAIRRLYEIKARDPKKAIALLVPDPSAVADVAQEPGEAAARLMQAFWPGALTLVFRLKPGLPDLLSSNGTIGVRMPDHAGVLGLLRLTGALAVTSANLSGAPSACSGEQALEGIGGQFELLLDGGAVPGGLSSTVVDCTGPSLRLLREGPISAAALEAACGFPVS